MSNAGHPLADAARLRPADLREPGLWLPASGSPAELLSACRQIAEHFGIPLDASGHNLGLEHAIDQVRHHPHRLILFGTDWPFPPTRASGGSPCIPRRASCGRWSGPNATSTHSWSCCSNALSTRGEAKAGSPMTPGMTGCQTPTSPN